MDWNPRQIRRWLPHAFAIVLLMATYCKAQIDPEHFTSDFKSLTEPATRIVGSPGYDQSAEFLRGQLASIANIQWKEHRFEVMVPVTRSATIAVEGVADNVYPFWPAHIRLNATPEAGITGKLAYLPSEDLKQLRPFDIAGQIVAVEASPGTLWQQAASLGARAIVVLGSDSITNVEFRTHDLPVPVNIPRFYLPESSPLVARIRAGKITGNVTLKAQVDWRRKIASNFYALVKPPKVRPEGWTSSANPAALMISAPFDSMSLVPDLSKGAGQAVQSAAALGMLREVAAHPLDRAVLFCFTSADGIQLLGTRQMFMAFSDVPDVWRKELDKLTDPEKETSGQITRLRALNSDPSKIDPVKDRVLVQRLARLIETDSSLEQDQLFRYRTTRKSDLTPSIKANLDRLEARQIQLNQLRFAVQQQPETLSGEDRDLAQYYLNRLQAQLEGDAPTAQEGLIQQYESRRGELNQRIALYEWLADALQKPKDPDSRSNNSRLIQLMVCLDFSDGGDRVGPMYYGWFQRTTNLGQIQVFRERMTRLEQSSKEQATTAGGDWFKKIKDIIDLEPLTGAREPQSWIAGTLPIPSELGQAWGIPAMTMMTLDDMRFRRDTPCDTPESLKLSRIIPQVQATRTLLFKAWNDPKFKDQVENKWLRTGFAGQVVSPAPGQPVPNLPRQGFLAAYYYVVNPNRKIPQLRLPPYTIGVRRNEIQDCDAEGNYRFEGLPRVHADLQQFAVQVYRVTPGTGEITACTDLGKQTGEISQYADIKQDVTVESRRSVVFDCQEISVSGLYDPRFLQELSEVVMLDARRNAEPLRYNLLAGRQFFAGFVEPGASSYLLFRYGRIGNRLILINMPENAAAKIESSTAGGTNEAGEGFSVDHVNHLGPISLQAASDFWQLDAVRLEKYRRAGVSSGLVDSLHATAGEQLQTARTAFRSNDGPSTIKNINGAWANEARVYQAAQDMASDVVRAAIFLLLLCVPFSFCMERLMIGSPGIYKQIAGVAFIFAIMTAALWSFHPAFKISSSPLIIILAFAIIFMSLVVISVVYGKFDTELKKIRSGRGTSEGVTFARGSVLTSAVLLGIANMRKRKFRTALTSTTIVLITFAVLCFTSSSVYVGTSSLPTGVPSDHPGIMLRQRGFRAMPLPVMQNLRSVLGDQPLIERWWNVNVTNPREMIHIRNGPKLFTAAAALGLSPGESSLSSRISDVIGKAKFDRLENGEQKIIYLSKPVANDLAVKEGSHVSVGGFDLEVAGIFDADDFDQKVITLSGELISPLKFASGALDAGGKKLDDVSADSFDLDSEGSAAELQNNYEHLSASQFVIVPASISKMLPNATLRSVAMRFDDEASVKKSAEELSHRLALALFAGYDDGVHMVVSSNLSSVSGGQVAVPLAIAGLIIFNTMMGSIAERKREIHVYTSLGLAPMHVGALFVAEAMTYGLIGTVFGYIIGQGIGTIFLKMGWLGGVTLNYSGSSAMMTMGLILLIVLMSALVPARLASKLAAPSIDRTWKVPLPKGDEIIADLPFTINKTAADGALAYLADFFDAHKEGSIGKFSAGKVETFVFEDEQKRLSRGIKTIIWLTPFDLGVRQHLMLLIHPGEYPDIYEVQVILGRLSGDDGSWYRMNRTFLTELRKQFLQWRSLSPQRMLELVEESKKLFANVPMEIGNRQSAAGI